MRPLSYIWGCYGGLAMEGLLEFAKITVPGLLVLYAAYLLVRTLTKGQMDRLHLEKRQETRKTFCQPA